ncbi:SCO family protein [Stenotrophobium rhamnosiphilum]|uniref:SCO family protein n=1 Tax=Stenotrophobium rhamnosiphilum TaxID=2029166 RepID=A0A2T5MET7_9GAMM|nr:SCO family protein [Stenotrophobium rhamnosiphilum]
MPVSSRILTVAVAVAAAVLGLAAASFLLRPPTIEIKSGTLLQQPRQLPEFALTRDNGQPYTLASLHGHWTLFFPGFITCPDVCPTTLAFLKTLTTKLSAEGQKLDVAFVSVDPERDTPERLASYVHYFNPEFIGVTAKEPELARFAQLLGIAYSKVPSKDGKTYTMDHTAALILVDPQGRIAAYFTPPHQLDVMSADLVAVMKGKQ